MDGTQAGRSGTLRDVIVEAGLALFAASGFEDVTVEQIARRAGVSPVTVYRHVGTKDAIVFDASAEATLLQALARTVPVDADPRRCVSATLRLFARRSRDEGRAALRAAVVARSPDLQRRAPGARREIEDAVSEALGSRPGAGAGWRTQTTAAAGLAVYDACVRRWRGDDEPGLVALVDGALDDLWPDLA